MKKINNEIYNSELTYFSTNQNHTRFIFFFLTGKTMCSHSGKENIHNQLKQSLKRKNNKKEFIRY